MSAFMHTFDTFDNIAATLAWRTEGVYGNYAERLAEDFAYKLFIANAESVKYRYLHIDEEVEEMDKLIASDYRPSAERGRILTDMGFYKLLYSVDYQSCEPPNWEDSELAAEVKKILDRLAHKFAQETPEWGKAKWG